MSVNLSNVYPGMQVAYLPRHIREAYREDPDILSRDGVEYGFVTTATGVAFCRFYYRKHDSMRTTANSEACSYEDLVVLPPELCHDQEEINQFIRDRYPYRTVGVPPKGEA